ncbi:MAG: hypothetical protein ACRC0V_09320, partial [Fusobacteriaceae bacterium]
METKLNLHSFLTESKRGGQKILYDGFGYNKKETKEEVIHWRCCKRGCCGIIKTDLSYNLLFMKNHSHEREFASFNDLKILNMMKKRALDTTETARDIIARVLTSEHASDSLSYTTRYLTSQICKARTKTTIFGENQASDIENIGYTSKGVKFILYDSCDQILNRIIVFGTESNIIHLMNNELWIIDGTFKVAPETFAQLVTIQVRIRGDFVPVLFALLTKKDIESYLRLFDWIKMHPNFKCPNYIVLDFEPALFNSLQNTFQTAKLSCCLFHLSQIVWRKLATLGFSCDYKSNNDFAWNVKLILALSFAPGDDIPNLSKKLNSYFIRENMGSKIMLLYNWFDDNFCVRKPLNNHDPEVWSVHYRTINGIPRTTNGLEGYHRHLNSVLNTTNPTLLKFIEGLLVEQQFNSKKMLDSLQCYWSRKASAQSKTEEIDFIISNYNSYYDIEFLKAV